MIKITIKWNINGIKDKLPKLYKAIIIIAALMKIFAFCYDILHHHEERVIVRNSYYTYHHYESGYTNYDRNKCPIKAYGETER